MALVMPDAGPSEVQAPSRTRMNGGSPRERGIANPVFPRLLTVEDTAIDSFSGPSVSLPPGPATTAASSRRPRGAGADSSPRAAPREWPLRWLRPPSAPVIGRGRRREDWTPTWLAWDPRGSASSFCCAACPSTPCDSRGSAKSRAKGWSSPVLGIEDGGRTASNAPAVFTPCSQGSAEPAAPSAYFWHQRCYPSSASK
jgi:hypothetical protein